MMGGPILVTFFVHTSYIFFFQSIYERVFNKCCLWFDPVVHQDCHMFSVVLNVTKLHKPDKQEAQFFPVSALWSYTSKFSD